MSIDAVACANPERTLSNGENGSCGASVRRDQDPDGLLTVRALRKFVREFTDTEYRGGRTP
jgi:hypothetical protein